MISLDRISRIGFGTHAISSQVPEHRDALIHAIRQGCTLVDTSANYAAGDAECLIGEILSSDKTLDAFVVSKSGVVVKDIAESVGIATDGQTLPLSEACGELQSLERMVISSLTRLSRQQHDGYLLHNPEADLIEGRMESKQLYEYLAGAFEVLERFVVDGVIRYYGISSNTFHLPMSQGVTIDLNRVIRVASSVSRQNRFKFIEFPYNLIESGATRSHHDGLSLLEVAHRNGIIALSNRPLNARSESGAIRLAIYPDDEVIVDSLADRAIVDEWLTTISRQLRAIDEPDDPLSFRIVRHLNQHWMDVGNPEAVEKIFLEHVLPFLVHIYSGAIPDTDRAPHQAFYDVVHRYSRHTRRRRSESIADDLGFTAMMASGRSLPALACEKYLQAGVDCVLVGMRKVRYVDELQHLFKRGL
ncbi:MAG: aldo/keto reductase [Planctomycetota bacterium]